MKLGIMQPYFFPYIGYFTLINYVDRFILFDTPQYINHGWINRNRILNQRGEARYITVPVRKAKRETSIADIEIDYTQNWEESILGSLTVYKRKAPYYRQTVELVRKVIASAEKYISDLNYLAIKEICYYLNIKTPIEIFSRMGMDLGGYIKAPDEWALYITKEMGYDKYINLPGGQTFFSKEKYKNENLGLEFIENMLPKYIQRTGKFIEGLSIIDVMMFCDKNTIVDMMNKYTITK